MKLRFLLSLLLPLVAVSSPIRDNLAAHHFTFLQEDAIVPISYLESTGTQYIILPVSISADDVISIVFIPRHSSANGAICCSSYGNNGNLLRRDTSNFLTLFLKSAYQIGSYVDNAEYSVSFGRGYATINGTTFSKYVLYCAPHDQITLFARPNGAQNGMCAIRAFSIEGKIDLIPVRIGSTGFMLDTLTGTLFGNSGTGDFLLGHDL